MIPEQYKEQEKDITQQVDLIRVSVNSEAAKGMRFIVIPGTIPELLTHFLNETVPKNYKVSKFIDRMMQVPQSALQVPNKQPQMTMLVYTIIERI